MVLNPTTGTRAPRSVICSGSYPERDAGSRKTANWRGALIFMEKTKRELNNPKMNAWQSFLFYWGKCPFCLKGWIVRWSWKKADCNHCARYWDIHENY